MKISFGQLLSGALVALLPLLAAADHVVPVDKVTSYVKIREAPDAGAEIVGRLHKSKPRPHVATVEGWYEVELDDGSSGFVSSDWSVSSARTGRSSSPMRNRQWSRRTRPPSRACRRRARRPRRKRSTRCRMQLPKILWSPSSLPPALVKRASHPGLPVLRDRRARRVLRGRRGRRDRQGRQHRAGSAAPRPA